MQYFSLYIKVDVFKNTPKRRKNNLAKTICFQKRLEIAQSGHNDDYLYKNWPFYGQLLLGKCPKKILKSMGFEVRIIRLKATD